MRFVLPTALASLVIACATSAPPSRASVGEAITRYDRRAPGGPSSVTVRHARADEAGRLATHRAVVEPPPRRGRRVDVHLHGATLTDALRFLAEAGGFGLVIDERLTTPVSLDLHRADARAAFDALAQAHGVEVVWAGDVAIVRQR